MRVRKKTSVVFKEILERKRRNFINTSQKFQIPPQKKIIKKTKKNTDYGTDSM